MEPQGETQSRVTAVVVDDDRSAREALKLLLQGPEIDVVAVCESAEDCLDAITRMPPQVALVDMQMYGDPYAGVTLIRQIRAVSPATVCLALTASDRRGDLLPKAFYAGAHGYYNKGYVHGNELPRIVCRLAQGAWELDPKMAARLLRHAVSDEDNGKNFTVHEVEMLRRIESGANTEILADTFDQRPSTIHRSIRNIMDKAQSPRIFGTEQHGLRYP